MVRPPRSRGTADAFVIEHKQENDATGTPSTRRVANIPSIILIKGASFSLITLSALAPLQQADIGAVQPGEIGKAFLRKTTLQAAVPHDVA